MLGSWPRQGAAERPRLLCRHEDGSANLGTAENGIEMADLEAEGGHIGGCSAPIFMVQSAQSEVALFLFFFVVFGQFRGVILVV